MRGVRGGGAQPRQVPRPPAAGGHRGRARNAMPARGLGGSARDAGGGEGEGGLAERGAAGVDPRASRGRCSRRSLPPPTAACRMTRLPARSPSQRLSIPELPAHWHAVEVRQRRR
eukprot:1442018-Rhodomonas_salina.1